MNKKFDKETLKDLLESYVSSIDGIQQYSVDSVLQLIEAYHDVNVVIPRGTNRHPFVDVLHAKLENSLLELEVAETFGKYRDCNTINLCDYTLKYRMKPSEPVYEYIWYKFVNGQIDSTSDWQISWFTEEEALKVLVNMKKQSE